MKKIKWKRVLIAALWAELLLFVIRIPILYFVLPSMHSNSVTAVIGILCWSIPLFLGGLWVVRTIDYRFILHGVLVGIISNILLIPLSPLMSLTEPATTSTTAQNGSDGPLLLLALSSFIKILASTLGAYIGGKQRKKLLSV